MAVMRGDVSIEEVVDTLIDEVKTEPFADIIEAVAPIIKEDLTNQKERYNERIRETPIVITRWQEDLSRNERSGEYSYSGLRRGGERGASAAYTGGERENTIVIPRADSSGRGDSISKGGSSPSYTDGNRKAQSRSAETNRRGEGADAQEVDYRHSLGKPAEFSKLLDVVRGKLNYTVENC